MAKSKSKQKSYYDQFIVSPGSTVDLSQIDPNFTGDLTGPDAEAKAKKLLKQNKKRINQLQEEMYAEGKHSLLLVLQAPDAAGKDGTIEKVFGAMNPNGHTVYPFKKPSEEEMAHDFLWRIHKATPKKGHVSTFNRSHYEDVLIVRVRALQPEAVWRGRYDEINAFERTVSGNGTGILKFYLHIDKDEQLKRFWDRVANPVKHWKVNNSDYSERQLWDQYRQAYTDAFNKCSTDIAPWFVIPANNKWFARLAISEILIKHFEDLEIHPPEAEADIDQVKKDFFGIKKSGDKPRFDLI